MEVFIHPEMQNKILRTIVKDIAQLDLLFLSYGQMTVIFFLFWEKMKFKILEVFIHPEMHNKIVRPMVKDLA